MSRPGPALEFQCQGLAPGQGSVGYQHLSSNVKYQHEDLSGKDRVQDLSRTRTWVSRTMTTTKT